MSGREGGPGSLAQACREAVAAAWCEASFGRAVAGARWGLVLAFLLGLVVLPWRGETMGRSSSRVTLSPGTISQGGVASVLVDEEDGGPPQLTWMGRKVFLVRQGEGKRWRGFLGVDLKTGPGVYELGVKDPLTGQEETIEVKVMSKDYGLRHLTLPREMVDLDAATLERVKEESRVMGTIWEAPPSAPLWSGPFARPLEGEVIGLFGVGSIINGQPRAPHSGVDLAAAPGLPVAAIHSGIVALIADHFFTGLSVVVDHGGGIQSMYFHLDHIAVGRGRRVTRGEVLGLAGATGRATGPHLHFGVRINGARVDPMEFIELSRRME